MKQFVSYACLVLSLGLFFIAPSAQADDYGQECGQYNDAGTVTRAICVRQGMCYGDNATEIIPNGGNSTCSDAPQGTRYVCCATASAASTDFSNSQYYGRQCSGWGQEGSQSGTCVRKGYCSDPSITTTECGDASLGGVCCPTPQNNTSNTSTNNTSYQNNNLYPTTGGWTEGKTLLNMLGLPTGSIGAIVASLVNMLLILLGFASMIAFLWAGFKYLFAAGDEDEAKSAKKAVKFSIYGIIVALSGVVVIQAVTAFLDGAGLF